MSTPNNVVRVAPGVLTRSSVNLIRNVAVPALRREGVIAVPTDTIYGLACLAQSTKGVESIYRIKGRTLTKPLAICVGQLDEVSKYGKVTIPNDLLGKLLPGPVTLIFERTPILNKSLNPQTNLVGIRIPDDDFLRSLLAETGEALALTSANRSNEPSALLVTEFQELWPELDAVLDKGRLNLSEESRKGSTVVDLSVKGHYRVVRPGCAFAQTVQRLHEYGLTEQSRRVVKDS